LAFLTAPPPTALPTLSLPDALPISLLQPFVRPLAQIIRQLDALRQREVRQHRLAEGELKVAAAGDLDGVLQRLGDVGEQLGHLLDRKSTRLNSSHVKISYAVFCLKK